ncbi:MAG: non-ribosomal peptide synthetase, partial [bacterium]|nr:non-ribosomal peptide synthetase [bacterium]
KYLCAYIITEGENDQTPGTETQNRDENNIAGELKNDLSGKIPEYMIPSYITVMDKIPLTPNGKIDRRALPEPKIKAGDSYIALENTIENKMAQIWQEVLEVRQTKVGIDDNFFQLGGHSLTAVLMLSRIYKTFNVRLPLAEVFRKPTIRGLSQYVKAHAGSKYHSVEPVEKREYYNLSAAQKRLYVLQQMDLENTVYNMPASIPLHESIDIERLQNIFTKLIQRHESLRTSFHMVAGEPVQKIHENVELRVRYLEEDQGTTETIVRPFDLSQAPLLRVLLQKTGTTGKVTQNLLVDMHHIIYDEVSHRILQHDFALFDKGEELPQLPIHYKDYSQWQEKPEQKTLMKQQETYWLKEFEGEVPLLDIPADFERPLQMTFQGASINTKVKTAITTKIKELAAQKEVTLLMPLLAVYNILLAKYCGSEDVVVGTVISGRQHPDLESIIGFFVNMLAIKTTPRKYKTFDNYLDEVKGKCLNAYENQAYQFEELVTKLDIERQPGRHPLIDTVFVLHETGETEENITHNDAGTGNYENETPTLHQNAHFDLMLHATATASTIKLMFEYSTALFKQTTIEDFAGYYIEILEQVVENPGIMLEDISITLNLLTASSNVIPEDDDDWDI